MTRPELTDHAITELLQQVVSDVDENQHPDRVGLRQRMLAEFDEAAAMAAPEPHQRNTAPVSPVHIADKATNEKRAASQASLSRRASWLVAACLLVAASTAIIFAIGSEDGRMATEPSVDLEIDDGAGVNSDEEPAGGVESTLVIDLDADLPRQLDADRIVFSTLGVSIAGNSSFDVVEVTADRVMLRPRSAEMSRGVTIQRVDSSIAPLDDLIDDARAAGHLTVQASQIQVGAEFLSSFSLSMTSEGEDAFGCASNSPCLALGPVPIWTDSVNELVEVQGPDQTRLWWVELGTSTGDLDLVESSRLLSSLEFVED